MNWGDSLGGVSETRVWSPTLLLVRQNNLQFHDQHAMCVVYAHLCSPTADVSYSTAQVNSSLLTFCEKDWCSVLIIHLCVYVCGRGGEKKDCLCVLFSVTCSSKTEEREV